MASRTTAAVLVELGKPLKLMEVTLPDLKPGQLLVDVVYSGVCQSQLLEARGMRGEDPYLPHTLGHEGSGTVLEVGAGVTKVKPGDAVVLSWIKGSGADVPSTTYQGDGGEPINSGAISTFMRHSIICENRVTPISPEIPLREAALLGCAIPTGAGIVLNTAEVSPGSSVAIFGVGGIGLSAVLGAGVAGASTIIAVDIFDHKLEQARRLGATHAVHAGKQDPIQAIMELTEGQGVDVAIEAAGRSQTMEAGFQVVRDGGGLCVLAGNLPKGDRISIDPFNLIRGKRIVGTWGGETRPDEDIPKYAGWIKSGKLNLDGLVTHTYPLVRINEALDDLEAGRVGRALISARQPQ